MYQNGGGGMAQFGQMGLNQFSQIQTPGGPMMMPVMMGPPPGAFAQQGMYPQPMYMMGPQQQQQQAMQNMQQQQQQQSQMQDEKSGSIPDRFDNQQSQQQEGRGRDGGGSNIFNLNNKQHRVTQSQANLPISKPSEGFAHHDRYDKSNKSREYANMLNYQLQLKNQKKNELKNYESLEIEKLRQERQRTLGFQSQGQIVRDQNGNIVNTKSNPANPNFQSQDWFSHVAHKDIGQESFVRPLAVSSSMQNMGQAPDLAVFDLDLKRQRELEQRLQTAKQMQSVQQDKISRAQDSFANASLSSSVMYSRPPPLIAGGGIGDGDIMKQRRRQEAIDLQREQLEQMEEKKRQKELKILQEKRERELEDLKVERERQEIELRMIGEFNNQQRGKKNLQETNFDASIMNSIMSQHQQSQPTIEPIVQHQLPKSALKKRQIQTPPDDSTSDVRVEQRIVRELPIEITTTVKETMHNELMRLRNEMNLHQNSLGEQILGMKSQLMQANERRHHAEDDVRKLKEELRKTQIIDEIRQRELYNAFVLTEKPKIHSNNTDKLYEQGEMNFKLPTRPKPYYNMQDPYLDNVANDFKNDNHGVLEDSSKHIPIGEYDYTANPISEKAAIEEKFFYDNEEQKDMAKRALHVDTETLFDLPDDYLNRQNLFYGRKKEFLSANANGEEDDIDYKEYIIKNQNRLDALEEINVLDQKGDYDRMDQALFDLAKHSQSESKSTNRRYHVEDNLKDIEDYVSFQSRLNRYG